MKDPTGQEFQRIIAENTLPSRMKASKQGKQMSVHAAKPPEDWESLVTDVASYFDVEISSDDVQALRERHPGHGLTDAERGRLQELNEQSHDIDTDVSEFFTDK